MKFSKRSLNNLSRVDANLRLVFETAIETSPYDFAITHGHRSPEQQRKLYDQGRTFPGKVVTNCDGYIKKSKHNYLPSKAVDIAIFVEGKLTWEAKYYKAVAAHISLIAYELNVKVTWGGNWKTFKDYPHFEIE
jgi:peptidoglycan L-alanyl-D-glutamate endopeptidase CwlK